MKGWRTVAFNVIMTFVSVYAIKSPGANAPDASVINAALDNVEALIPFIWGIGNVILRAVTTTPIFKSSTTE
jgi:hypothetical protein